MSTEPSHKVSVAVDACLAACHRAPNQRATFEALTDHYAAEPGWTMGDLFELRRHFINETLDAIEAQQRAELVKKTNRDG